MALVPRCEIYTAKSFAKAFNLSLISKASTNLQLKLFYQPVSCNCCISLKNSHSESQTTRPNLLYCSVLLLPSLPPFVLDVPQALARSQCPLSLSLCFSQEVPLWQKPQNVDCSGEVTTESYLSITCRLRQSPLLCYKFLSHFYSLQFLSKIFFCFNFFNGYCHFS